MKKITTVLLILLMILFSPLMTKTTYAHSVFKEGVYKASDFAPPINGHEYTLENVSSSHSIYVLVFDETLLGIQSIQLEPNSKQYNLLPLKPEYRFVIVGKGEARIY